MAHDLRLDGAELPEIKSELLALLRRERARIKRLRENEEDILGMLDRVIRERDRYSALLAAALLGKLRP